MAKHVTKESKVVQEIKASAPRTRKRKKIAPTIPLSNRKEDGNPIAGHEARLASYIKRTLELKRLDYYHHEVALMIANEYKLERVPAITTVADWYRMGMAAVREDIEELQWQMRIEQFKQLEQLKAKWFPLAMADSLAVTRWKMEEGSLQPDLDENAVKEQLEATKQIVNIMNRQAKLLGLDLAQATTKDGEGPGSLQDLQLWLVGQININHPGGGSVDISSEVLELRSGIEEVDAV